MQEFSTFGLDESAASNFSPLFREDLLTLGDFQRFLSMKNSPSPSSFPTGVQTDRYFSFCDYGSVKEPFSSLRGIRDRSFSLFFSSLHL